MNPDKQYLQVGPGLSASPRATIQHNSMPMTAQFERKGSVQDLGITEVEQRWVRDYRLESELILVIVESWVETLRLGMLIPGHFEFDVLSADFQLRDSISHGVEGHP